MSFLTRCQNCRQLLSIPDEADEKKVRCPSCESVFLPEYSFDPEIFFLEYGIPKERAWVGEIMDLILTSLNEWDLSNIDDWTIYILEVNRAPSLIMSSRSLKSQGKKFCTLGQCRGFALFKDMLEGDCGSTERIVQEMAFEICRVIEPNWDELIKQRWD